MKRRFHLHHGPLAKLEDGESQQIVIFCFSNDIHLCKEISRERLQTFLSQELGIESANLSTDMLFTYLMLTHSL